MSSTAVGSSMASRTDECESSDVQTAMARDSVDQGNIDNRIKTIVSTAATTEVSIQITDLAYLLGQLDEVRENNRLLQLALVEIKSRMSTHNGAVVDQLIDRYGVTRRQQYM